MPDWSRIVKHLHSVAHAEDEFKLVMQNGVGTQELDLLASTLGIELPAEFRDLYSKINGFGVNTDAEPQDISWLFFPLAELPDFIDSMRSSFDQSHPELAARFFPFIDWDNGDAMGYLVDEDGIILPGLFCFEHEAYEYDETQDSDEFIAAVPVTIEQLLSTE